jgi:hypothetical protein
MGRILILGLIGAVLGGGLGTLIAISDDEDGPMFIAGELPITEDRVRAKLETDGWAVIQMTRDDRYIEASASKNGRTGRLMVDTLTGQLIGDDRDED